MRSCTTAEQQVTFQQQSTACRFQHAAAAVTRPGLHGKQGLSQRVKEQEVARTPTDARLLNADGNQWRRVTQ